MDRIDIVHDVALEVLEDDPYPTYAWMRRHRPIAYVPETGRVWITTWDLCDEAGRNDKVFGLTSEVFHAVYGNPNVMSLSGPEHLAHRAALNACFRPRAVNGYREHVLRATAVRYIDAIRDRGQADANSEILRNPRTVPPTPCTGCSPAPSRRHGSVRTRRPRLRRPWRRA